MDLTDKKNVDPLIQARENADGELVSLTGHLGTSVKKGIVRLYTDSSASAYYEIPQDAVVHARPIDETKPKGGIEVFVGEDSEVNLVRRGKPRDLAFEPWPEFPLLDLGLPRPRRPDYPAVRTFPEPTFPGCVGGCELRYCNDMALANGIDDPAQRAAQIGIVESRLNGCLVDCFRDHLHRPEVWRRIRLLYLAIVAQCSDAVLSARPTDGPEVPPWPGFEKVNPIARGRL